MKKGEHEDIECVGGLVRFAVPRVATSIWPEITEISGAHRLEPSSVYIRSVKSS